MEHSSLVFFCFPPYPFLFPVLSLNMLVNFGVDVPLMYAVSWKKMKEIIVIEVHQPKK